jgi:rubrerythrin
MEKEHSHTLEILQTALRMEIDGKKYYLQVSVSSSSEAGKKLFAALADEEDIHIQNFERIFNVIAAGQNWPEVQLGPGSAASIAGIFDKPPVGIKGATSTELKSVQKAMDMEKKTLDYYTAQSRNEIIPAAFRYYTDLAGQEKIHYNLLLDYFEFIKDPAQWFTVKERHSLDGG